VFTIKQNYTCQNTDLGCDLHYDNSAQRAASRQGSVHGVAHAQRHTKTRLWLQYIYIYTHLPPTTNKLYKTNAMLVMCIHVFEDFSFSVTPGVSNCPDIGNTCIKRSLHHIGTKSCVLICFQDLENIYICFQDLGNICYSIYTCFPDFITCIYICFQDLGHVYI